MARAFLVSIVVAMAMHSCGVHAGNVLYSGQVYNIGSQLPKVTLRANEMIGDNSGNYFAIMKDDCNFVLYITPHFCSSNILWSSGTAGRGSGCYLQMQSDNNLVIYDQTPKPIWSANTYQSSGVGSLFRIQDDGNLVVYDPSSKALWATGTSTVVAKNPASCKNDLNWGDQLNVGEMMCSDNRAYYAVMQNDCRFVLYRSSSFAKANELWSSPDVGSTGCHMAFGYLGAMVWDSANKLRWSSQNETQSVAITLRLRNDGNLVLTNPVTPIFATNTGHCTSPYEF